MNVYLQNFNSLNGLIYFLKMGCVCGKEAIFINNRRFYIRSSLGEGGFSYVDLIEDARSHKTFALKRIKCHSKEDENVAMREVEIMKLFKHPRLIPLEEFVLVPVGRYAKNTDICSEMHIVMPYYSRGSLQDRIEMLSRKGDKIQENRLWDVFLGICEGVKAMHTHDPPYAHRDLKPANIMFGDDNSPIIMDLGSAAFARKDIRTMQEARALQDIAAERCSMQYRAPELFNVENGAHIDERTDIWSLGCVLYALAFLGSPFEQDYQRGNSIALAVLGGNVKYSENSGYSKQLEETITMMMAVNPMERPFIEQVIQAAQLAKDTHENRV